MFDMVAPPQKKKKKTQKKHTHTPKENQVQYKPQPNTTKRESFVRIVGCAIKYK